MDNKIDSKNCDNLKDQESISLSKVQMISTISDLAKNLSINDEFKFNKSKSNAKSRPTSSNHRVSDNQASQSMSIDVVDVMPKCMSFTWFDILLNLFSIFCYLIDFISDIITCYIHYQTKNSTLSFFYLTLVFIIMPTLVTTLISLRW